MEYHKMNLHSLLHLYQLLVVISSNDVNVIYASSQLDCYKLLKIYICHALLFGWMVHISLTQDLEGLMDWVG